jgi:hypothetical protein
MTDEELQKFADMNVRLVYAGKSVEGKLIAGYTAQLRVNAPYAIQWYDINKTLGTHEERLVAIELAESVESVEILDEPAETAAEIEEVAEDAQTPG